MSTREVGIRAINQNAGRILRSLRDDDMIIVTDHGHPIATIAPYREPGLSGWEKMVRDSRITPARGSGAFPEPNVTPPPGATSDAILAEMRGDH